VSRIAHSGVAWKQLRNPWVLTADHVQLILIAGKQTLRKHEMNMIRMPGKVFVDSNRTPKNRAKPAA
jgi:hypothetical protein